MAMTVASSAPTETTAANRMESIGKDLAAVRESAWLIDDRLSRVLTRAFGSEPTPAQGNPATPKAVPNGALAAIDEQMEDIRRVVNSLSARADRLDNLV